MTALQFLADSSANDAIREKLREFPNRVYFPNFGKGDNIFKEGIDIDRVLFTVPGTNFKIYWYGFLITIGILLAMIYGFRRMKTVGIDPDRATDAVIGGLIGAIFGARFYYIIFNTEGMKFSEFFDIRDGGLAIYGGLIGAILVGGIIAKIRKLKLPHRTGLRPLGQLLQSGGLRCKYQASLGHDKQHHNGIYLKSL